MIRDLLRKINNADSFDKLYDWYISEYIMGNIDFNLDSSAHKRIRSVFTRRLIELHQKEEFQGLMRWLDG